MPDKIGRIAEHLADENEALRAENERLIRLLREHGIEDVQSLPAVETND